MEWLSLLYSPSYHNSSWITIQSHINQRVQLGSATRFPCWHIAQDGQGDASSRTLCGTSAAWFGMARAPENSHFGLLGHHEFAHYLGTELAWHQPSIWTTVCGFVTFWYISKHVQIQTFNHLWISDFFGFSTCWTPSLGSPRKTSRSCQSSAACWWTPTTRASCRRSWKRALAKCREGGEVEGWRTWTHLYLQIDR